MFTLRPSATELLDNREAAGRELARALGEYANRDDVLVLALPRGGVPVGYEIARQLGLPMDLLLVRKLGIPGHEELAMGAIGSGGVRVMNRELIESAGISEPRIQQVVQRENLELERRQLAYRGDRVFPDVENRTIILVDDGIATGATMRAAIRALRQMHPARVILAVPVAAADSLAHLGQQADDVICLNTPSPFGAVGNWYRDFSQTTDEQVREALHSAWQRHN